MNEPNIDEALRGSASRFTASAASRAALDALVVETRSRAASASKRRAHRVFWIAPVAVVAAGALTGGGVLFAQYMNPDVRVPIEYTTTGGTEIGCTLAIRVDSSDTDVRDWLITNDWSGIGQRIYDDALANPYAADGDQSQQEIDALSFRAALARALDAELATDVGATDAHLSAVADCEGTLS